MVDIGAEGLQNSFPLKYVGLLVSGCDYQKDRIGVRFCSIAVRPSLLHLNEQQVSGGGHSHHITDRVVIIAEPTIPEEHPDDSEDYSIMPQVGNRLFYQSCTRISNGETRNKREREVKM